MLGEFRRLLKTILPMVCPMYFCQLIEIADRLTKEFKEDSLLEIKMSLTL
jgi:hypothetical protein